MNLKNEFKEKSINEEAEILKSIKRLVKINSIEGNSTINAPFGEAPKKALEEALDIAKEMGFTVKNIDNAIGYAEYKVNDSEDYVCVIGHVDIVKAGEGWDYDPFNLTVEKGRIYGRGVLDNKGPIMAALHSLKIIKEMNIPLSNNVRIIFGTNEETGFKDIPYYFKKEKPPIMGFTPDCKYPAVYGERGILDVTIWGREIEEEVELTGEFVNNVVPSYAKIKLKKVTIECEGKQAPGNAPEMGENAVTEILSNLSNYDISKNIKEFATFCKDNFHNNHSLEKSGIVCRDDISGSLVINPYKLEKKDGKLGISIVFRYPITYKYEDIKNIIHKMLLEGYSVTENRRMDSVCFDKNHRLLKELKEAYEVVTGEDGTAVTTTGGTYAKVFKNIVAFGPSFPGQKGIAHNKNEYMDISDLIKNIEIFLHAIYNISK